MQSEALGCAAFARRCHLLPAPAGQAAQRFKRLADEALPAEGGQEAWLLRWCMPRTWPSKWPAKHCLIETADYTPWLRKSWRKPASFSPPSLPPSFSACSTAWRRVPTRANPQDRLLSGRNLYHGPRPGNGATTNAVDALQSPGGNLDTLPYRPA